MFASNIIIDLSYNLSITYSLKYLEILRFGKYVIIEKGTHALTTAVKTNITIHDFHRSCRLRRLLEELLSIF